MVARSVGAAVAIVALAVAMGGCFGFFGVTFTKTNLRPNPPKKSKTVAKVRSQPLLTEAQKSKVAGRGGGLPSRDYPFFLIATSDDEIKFRAGGARFDVPGRFGPRGGRRLVRDDALRAQIDALTGDPVAVCGNDIPEDPEDYLVYRTQNRVRDRGKVRVKTYSKLPFRQTGLTDGSGEGITIQIGTWFDDGDGVPEDPSQEFIGCAGGGFFNLNFKEGPLSPRAARQGARYGP